jgi:peptidyl-prolyl cis-trans isomerase B (cyclophilin B)
MKKILTIGLTLVMVCFLFVGCGGGVSQSGGGNSEDLYKGGNVVKIEMESGGVIEIELYPNLAPKTVANFEKLVKEGFYDGTIFHRVIPGFMVQGGDPEGTGMGGSDQTIEGEFSSNGFDNELKHTRGVVSMARSSDPNSASSQFFIMVADATHLDGEYAAFGKVTSGMEVVDEIVAQPTDASDKPKKDQVMKSVTLEEK